MFTLARRAQITVWKGSVANALHEWKRCCHASMETGDAHNPQLGVGMVVSSIGESTAHVSRLYPGLIALLTDLDSVRILAGAHREPSVEGCSLILLRSQRTRHRTGGSSGRSTTAGGVGSIQRREAELLDRHHL